MTWGWNARGPLPVDSNATGTTGGGAKGGVAESGVTHAWPRYEAEYLKRALQSDRHKYDTGGLDNEERQVYLDKVTSGYKAEADECLKAEFEQWLQGLHECNAPDQEYVNAEGKPIRRWVVRSKESEDAEGHSKVGQARAGWSHTPWGRAALTHLPGVRDYLRSQKERANEQDLKMQILAEYGPQNIEDAWRYFKHWVKGRPLSDAVALPAHFDQPAPGARADIGPQMPQRMHAYDPDPSDRQPQVYATDRNAYNSAVTLPGEQPPILTNSWEDRNVHEARQLREELATVWNKELAKAHAGEDDGQQRAKAAEFKDEIARVRAETDDLTLKQEQGRRLEQLTGPHLDILR